MVASIEFQHHEALETFQEEGSSSHDEDATEREQIHIAKAESRQVGCLRFLLIGVVVVVAAGVSSAVYFFSRRNEHENFETQVCR